MAQLMEPKIRKSSISCTQEIRELVSTILSANGSTILDHLYNLPMEKFCLRFKDKCSHFISAPHNPFHLGLDPTCLKPAVISSKKWHEHTEACLITTSPQKLFDTSECSSEGSTPPIQVPEACNSTPKKHLKANSDCLRLADDLSENKHACIVAPNYYSNLKPPQPANARGEDQSHAEIAFSSWPSSWNCKIAFCRVRSAASYFGLLHPVSLRKKKRKELQVTSNL